MVKALRYYSEGPGIDSRWCHWNFKWHISFRPYHGPGVDSAASENEYQEYFLGVKAAGVWSWQPHQLHVPNVMEIWEPKHPGTLWVSPGLLREFFTFTFSSVYQSRCTVKNSWWWAESLPETCRVVIPIKLEFGASVGFIHKESVTMHGHTITKNNKIPFSLGILRLELSFVSFLQVLPDPRRLRLLPYIHCGKKYTAYEFCIDF